MTKKQEKRGERLQMMLTFDEIERLDEWRFANRMPSRSAAARALMKMGFETAPDAPAESAGAQGVNSADVGMIETDRQVEQAVEGRDSRLGILVSTNDAMAGHAVKSVLEDAGYGVVGPELDPGRAKDLAASTRDLAAIVLVRVADAPIPPGQDDLVGLRDVPIVVCLPSDLRGDLPEALALLPMLSYASAATALPAMLADLLSARSAS